MELYNEIMIRTRELLQFNQCRKYCYRENFCYKETESSELVMLRNMAYELGGSGSESVNYSCVTTNEQLVGKDEVLCYGPDLKQITGDVSFARIVFLSIKDIGNDEEAYKAIRNIEYTKYHVFPKGYMIRISAESHQEQVRVSTQSLENGISFEWLGNSYIRRYKEDTNVKHVQVLFLTDCDIIRELIPNAKKVDAITSTLTHIMDGIPISCNTCSLKSVCDEVEGLREMHLGRRAKLIKEE